MKAKVSDKQHSGLALAGSKAAGLVCQASCSSSLPLGIPASSREGFLLLTLSLTHPLQLDAASGIPVSVPKEQLGMCSVECWDVWHITTSHGWDLLKSHQSSPFVPLLSGRIKGREGLWAGIFPWLPASVSHGRIPSLTWMLPPVPCVPLTSRTRGEHDGSRLDQKLKNFLMQTLPANPQLEQGNHYSTNKR